MVRIEDYENHDSEFSDEDSELESDLGGFIVPDDEEPFCLAQLDNEWVEETHKLVEHYSHGSANTNGEQVLRNCIEQLENV